MLHMNNDVSNHQDATTFSFINLFNSALHVSGDKLAHPQEHFLTIYSFWYNAPTLGIYPPPSQFHLTRGTGRQQCRCIVPKSKGAPEDGRVCRSKTKKLLHLVGYLHRCPDWKPDFPKEDYSELDVDGSLIESALCLSKEMLQCFFRVLCGVGKVM